MKKVKIGSVGLGRLGYEHACNIANLIPGAELAALCDVDEKRVKEVAAELGVPYTYTDVAEMVKNPELDAIVIVSPSMYHADHIKLALDAGKHVFCDKPLDTTIEKCKQAEKAVEAHPDKVFMLGFMRRFDDSYAEAKQRIENGDIGKVVLVRSYTQDPRTTIEGTLKFAPHSGGQFLDMCVHDIDLIRWFTGSNIKKVWGIGGVFEFDLYRELNDADNAAATVQCENGAMGFMFTNRTHGAGCNVETEIIGTHGTLRIANIGRKNMLQIVDGSGAREEYYPDFLSRWHQAYVNEIKEFVACINEGRKPGVTVYDGTKVSQAAYRCKESFETGKLLEVED
ncbi:MAG TPA: Gfo/Idh/MocA family oxidoreductase [Candidatus Agathobaculum stercoravium]|nr:Gfo/Idh/MocA family oxidoreductase [uncultured Agathobaculum sp.]HIV96180.1 Gfo/Idh/MocA family oxidoreductase [Candidatus Agathobaculum stercoravium]